MEQIIKLFKENGFQLYQVGGSVRDKLLGLEPHDIDFATDATPDEMLKLRGNDFNKIKVWHSENGKAHGTIVFQEDGIDYEITTFRCDVSTDGRNAIVEFAKTIEEDLSRRDFTINSMATNMENGNLIDLFGGQEDLKNHVIRFVGNARERFNEDRLRLLRAYRFLSQLGKGWKFINADSFVTNDQYELQRLSNERIRDELIKIFQHNPCFALYHMPDWLKEYIFEDLDIWESNQYHGHFHAENIDQHLIFTLATAVRLTDNPLLRLACFLHDVGKYCCREINDFGFPTFIMHDIEGSKKVELWMKSMKFDNKQIDYVTRLVKHHMVAYDVLDKSSNKVIKRFVRRIGEDILDDMILLNYCDRAGNLANIHLVDYPTYLKDYTIKPRWLEIKAKDDCFKITDLKVNGYDVIAAGFQGKEVGRVLTELFESVEREEIVNEKEVLLCEIDRIKQKGE